MNNNKLFALLFSIIVICMIIGGTWGTYIMYGEIRAELVVPIFVGTFIGLIIAFFVTKWRKKKNGNIPDVDERTFRNVQTYINYFLYFILVVSGVILLLLYSVGVQTIQTGWLIVSLMILYLLFGAGTVIVKRL